MSINSIDFISAINEESILTASFSGRIIKWDLNTLESIGSAALYNELECIEVINQNLAVSGYRNKFNLVLWDINKMKKIKELEGHTDCIRCIVVINNHTIASGSVDKTIKIWDLNSYSYSNLKGNQDSVFFLFSIPGNRIASRLRDCTLKIWDIETKTCINTIDIH